MSKIEVNTVEPQCGTTVTVGKCTTTVAVPGNVVKSNALQASDGGNIVSQSGTDITLGASGDTINLASGASQSGFGRTGTVDWDTSIHTGTVTAATGKGYFVNTTSGGITVNLPAAAVGSIVAVSDYASTAASNNITLVPNGSEKINGDEGDYTIETAGLAVTLVYADATRGWKSVTGSDADATGKSPLYITATGGTPCTGAIVCTNYKVHTFTGPGTFVVSCAGNACGSNTADYLVIAGGGGGGAYYGGGAGAGGYRESPGTASGCYTVSPLGTSPAVALPLPATPYPIVVGGGGAGASTPGPGANGNDSSFSTITSTAGGAGAGLTTPANDGGSGGGGSGPCSGATGGRCGGAGNTPSVTPPQGSAGVTVTLPQWAGAGGGATAAGCIRVGGAGGTSSIDGTPTGRAGGGAGGPSTGTVPRPGAASATCGGGDYACNATVNTGGGGGSDTGDGGSGIVIIRYKFQN
jgi:hypothetical protein